ncbi:CPA1 family monovalent cation:H+ antiporter [Agromyces aurantiacus]|nr:CPA1 family monovalent cation:H+ antiporter [Agromyces aurantiacus]
MTAVAWTVAFVLVTVTVTGFSRRLGWSAPVLLVVIGGLASYLPGVPRVALEPELVLSGVLPPLLFAEAVRTSLIDIRNRRDSIVVLSVGTVLFTVIVVGFATSALLPAVGLAAAFAFAAVVAPNDTIAVSAIASRIGLPRRVVTVLEGESLLNDATALAALHAAILALSATVTPVSIAGEFALAVVAGVAVGLAIGGAMSKVRSQLQSVVLDTSLALVTPYVAFIAAQSVLGSGVLAVVVAGLYLGYRSPGVQSAAARIAESVNWRTIQFLLENAVFLFIGLNLSTIVAGAIRTGPGLWPTIGISAAIVAALVAARFVFVLSTALVFRAGPRRLREQNVQWRNAVAVAAANVRGVVTLAAVFLLPPDTPYRDFLQFLAFVVVVATLLGGLALPTLVRRLRLPPPNREQERMEWQGLMVEAQAAGLAELNASVTDADEERVVSQLRAGSTLIAESIERRAMDLESESLLAAYSRLRGAMIRAERDAVLTARNQGRFPERAVKSVLRAIDAEELALRANAMGQDPPHAAEPDPPHHQTPPDDLGAAPMSGRRRPTHRFSHTHSIVAAPHRNRSAS